MNYIEQFVLADFSSVGHAVMVWAENCQIVDVVCASVSDRDNVMNVNVNVPTAYHAFCAEVLTTIGPRHVMAVRAAKVRIAISSDHSGLAFWPWFTEPICVNTLATAKFGLAKTMRFDAKHLSALLTSDLYAGIRAEFWMMYEHFRLSLICAYTGTVVFLSALGWFTVEHFAALRARNVMRSVLLALRRTLARAVVASFSVAVGDTRPTLELLAAHVASIGLHDRSYVLGVDCRQYIIRGQVWQSFAVCS